MADASSPLNQFQLWRALLPPALRVLLEEAADPELIPRQTVFLPELVARASTRARR